MHRLVLIINCCISLLLFQATAYADNSVDTLTYCIDPDWMPYEALRNNRHVGVSADYLDLIEERSGIQFSLLPTTDWRDTLIKARGGECEAVLMLNKSPEREQFLRFTRPYFNSATALVNRSGEDMLTGLGAVGDKRLAVVDGYRMVEYVATYYPDISIVLVANELAGLRAVAERKADVFAGSTLTVNTHLHQQNFRTLQIAGIGEPYDWLGMGVIPAKAYLLPKLDDAIGAVTEAEHVEIFRRWNNVRVINHIDYTYVYWGLAALALISTLVLLRNRSVESYNRQLIDKNLQLENLKAELLEKNRRLEYLSTHDPLSGLFNRRQMSHLCEAQLQRAQRFKEPVSLIVFDIDRFKQINDSYGHNIGDEVIQQLADAVKDTVREVDAAARWGGEEFVVLCPQTAFDSAKILAERLRHELSKQKVGKVERLTCSFGVAQWSEGETFGSWFERADKALYQAKRAGRDSVVVAA